MAVLKSLHDHLAEVPLLDVAVEPGEDIEIPGDVLIEHDDAYEDEAGYAWPKANWSAVSETTPAPEEAPSDDDKPARKSRAAKPKE